MKCFTPAKRPDLRVFGTVRTDFPILVEFGSGPEHVIKEDLLGFQLKLARSCIHFFLHHQVWVNSECLATWSCCLPLLEENTVSGNQ